ncbi:MAG: ArsI/CadI family heavy metal resistance metalloenzyme [Myxococcota bacterium]|nr:ArsI/CadI family heavy metal resistance metalloenzyme [Myxococcota bacterium]
MRLQLALNVTDLDEAIDFYSKMFGTKVNKRKPGYANFAIDQPPLKLVLFEAPDASERLNHLGVEVFDDEDVTQATERLREGGMRHLVQDETTCCYAKSDKVWTVEPDGLRWEWYKVLADSDTYGDDPDGADPRTVI